MPEYIKGQTLSLSGRDIVAHAERPDTKGSILVLNDRFTHYLVVQYDPATSAGHGDLIQSIAFDETEEGVYRAYVQALAIMAVSVYNVCHPDLSLLDPGERVNGGDPACPRA